MRAATTFAAMLVLLVACTAAASPRDYLVPFCIEDVREIPVWVQRLPIPVGCELVDCCPGCPGPGPLDWRVRLAGAPLAAVGVRFEGLAPGAPIKIEGDARPIPGGALIGPRGATLGNLSGERDRVAVASLELRLDAAALEKLQQLPGGTDRDLGEIDVAIEQRLGPVAVNEFRYRAILRHCTVAPATPCDQIVQHDNFDNDRSVLQLDGRLANGCLQDRLYRSPDVTQLDNVLSPDTTSCKSDELAVYSGENAMWIEPSAGFTDACDTIDVPLTPVLRAPVSIWFARPILKTGPALDAPNADWIYDAVNKAGVTFDVKHTDLSSNSAATQAALAWCIGLGALRSAGHYDANRLNVYYSLFPMTGQVCPQDRNAIFVGTLANIATLAHEFGHTFTLGHVQAGFTTQNLMIGGGPATRDHLSLGQAFRVNVEELSSLNENNVRNDDERQCLASGDCLPLALDWSRP